MLVGGDLGFSCVVLVVVLFGPVIGFVVRRKWRLALARKEEIKRLLVFASEEAARAELEATAGYGAASASSSQQLQYLCAVCFCLTTTRCARCKAVRYCSGKCQIIHWRQGHKEECRPFTTTHQINDGNSFETEMRQCTKPIETFPEEPEFSNSSQSQVLNGKDDIEVECLADGKGTKSISEVTTRLLPEEFSASIISSESSVDANVSNSSDSDGSDRHQSTKIAPDKVEGNCAKMDQARPPSSEHPTVVNSVDSFTSSGKIDPSCGDGDTHHGSSSSSGWSVDGSNGSSFSEPSTPSSGFWDGTIDSGRSRIDALDDCARSSSNEAGDGKISDSRSSLSFSSDLAKNAVPPIDVEGSIAKTIRSDDAHATNSGTKKPIDGAALSEDLSKGGLKPRKSPSLSSDLSNDMGVDTCSDSRIVKSRELRYSSSSASYVHPASSSGENSTSKDDLKFGSLPSLSSERSNYVVNGMSGTSHTLKSGGVGSLSSKASDAHLSSSTGRPSVQSAKPVKVDNVHGVAATSHQLAGYSDRNGLKTSMKKVVDQLKVSKLSRHYQLGSGSEIAGRYNNKGLFPYDVFVKIYNWNKVELRPCGLTNCGNSCYANAVLQCLAFTPPLTAYLLQGLHSKACEKKEWCFTCEFESLILKAKEGNSPLSPFRILSQIQNIGSHLGNGKEEDAHEFLRYAIDAMQSVCLKEVGLNVSCSLEEETTLIGLTFGGYLRSKIQCMKCGGKSERHERMMDLTVEIEGDIGTLEEALRQFTGTEILDGENKYQCSRCKSYEKAKKKLTVLEAPNVLTIALKRFQSGKFGKLNKSILFPEILDLAPYMSGTSDKSPIYRLYGVVVHVDIMNAAFSGHYVCYVKNIQNKWFKIDDSKVKPVELERVLTKGAYMLLYARCSPRAPRLIRNSIIPRDPRKPKNPTYKSRSHPRGPLDVSVADPMNGQTSVECFSPDHNCFQRNGTILEEDCSSDNSSSLFSEAGSCSTESSNRDSSSTDDYFDHIFSDLGRNCNSPWRNSSDSDNSSSSSSPSLSPLYSRHSPLADLDRYASRYPETSCPQIDNAESAADGNGYWSRLPSSNSRVESSEGKGSVLFLKSDITKQRRTLVSGSNSCREADSDRLGRVNPLDNMKSGASFRRSMWERTD